MLKFIIGLAFVGIIAVLLFPHLVWVDAKNIVPYDTPNLPSLLGYTIKLSSTQPAPLVRVPSDNKELNYCSKCNAIVPAESDSCKVCKTKLERQPDDVVCPSCKAEQPWLEVGKYCNKCGKLIAPK